MAHPAETFARTIHLPIHGMTIRPDPGSPGDGGGKDHTMKLRPATVRIVHSPKPGHREVTSEKASYQASAHRAGSP